MILAPLVWPFLVLVRVFLGVPSAWDLGFLPITLAVHALASYLAFLLLGLPAAIYLARDGRSFVGRGLVVGAFCGLVALGLLSGLRGSQFTPANVVWAALAGALTLAAFAGLVSPVGPGQEAGDKETPGEPGGSK